MNLIRGDTFLKKWQVYNEDGTLYIFQPNDIVRYCLYKDLDVPILNKQITIEDKKETVDIIYSNDETKELESGKYILEIELTFNDSFVKTFKHEIILERDAIV